MSYVGGAAVLRSCRADTRTQGGRTTSAVFGDPGGDLPHARSEAESVARVLGTRSMLGAEVSPNAVGTALASARVLHFAGHARFDAVDPMASGLCLAGDAVLTAREIAGRPGPQMALLSGCETGISLHHPGDDVQGLVRGFLSAGTTTILASLWRVSDDSAGHMMTRFHENVRDGTDAVDALRHAVLATRDHSDRWSSMHHWAPFVLVGNWGVR